MMYPLKEICMLGGQNTKNLRNQTWKKSDGEWQEVINRKMIYTFCKVEFWTLIFIGKKAQKCGGTVETAPHSETPDFSC